MASGFDPSGIGTSGVGAEELRRLLFQGDQSNEEQTSGPEPFRGREQFRFNIPENISGSNLYQLLGLNFNASSVEVRKAYRSRARQVHPDKNPNLPYAEEHMKRLNEAYRVLSDKIHRADYDDQLQEDGTHQGWTGDPIGALTQGMQPSQEFMKLFRSWGISVNYNSEIGLFKAALKDSLSKFLGEQINQYLHMSQCHMSSPKLQSEKETNISPLTELLQVVTAKTKSGHLQMTRFQATVEVDNYATLAKMLDRIQKSEGQMLGLPNNGVQVPILDLSSATNSDLNVLLSLFAATDQSSTAKVSRETLLRYLSEYIPRTHVQTLPASDPIPLSRQLSCYSTKCTTPFTSLSFRKKLQCIVCTKSFCSNCLHACQKLPRYGKIKPEKICELCKDRLLHQDMEDWTEAGLNYLKKKSIGQVRAALGCFTMALTLYPQSARPAFQLARELFNQGLHEIAVPAIADLLQHCKDPKEKLKAYLLMATATKALAEQPYVNFDEQYFFLMAAKESLIYASEMKLDSPEVPDLAKRTAELNSALTIVVHKIECDQNSQVKIMQLQMEQAWFTRDYERLLTLVTEERVTSLANSKDCIVEALRQFLVSKETFMEKMLPEDRYPLIFFRGLVKLHDGKFSDGLSDIENAAWGGHGGTWLTKAVSDIVLTLLDTHPEQVFPFHAIRTFCESFSTVASRYGTTDDKKSAFRLLPTTEELNPPSKLHWPSLTIEGLNTKARRKYEQAVARNLQNGEWAERDAALAYIDLTAACEHPAEVAICFITASLWFLKELRKATGSTSSPSNSELYALKKAILHCLEQANILSRLSLHPGMQMYICRLALGTALTATQLVGSLATSKDGKFVVDLLSSLIYNSRFCPFWHPPIVMVSEAVLLNIFTGRFHSEFILGLQTQHSNQCPVSVPELRYQLYENDLRLVRRLQDHKGALTRTMEAMLQERGWSWEDVTDTMSSPLTARTPDGWFIQQPHLNIPMEYGKLKGFVFNLDNPSIELLIEPSRVGLFSRSDVDTVLGLDGEAYLFSLDPPSKDQHFHPFQELRYSPEKLKDTDLLHTMLQTDYLLKSFSVGSDVSAKPPFNQRPCSEGLTANLPEHLCHALRRVSERGRSLSRISRFWIQADELVYDSKQSGSRLEFHLEEPKMVINTHQILPGSDGKLQDTDEKDDPDSPEAKFAADLTAHYGDLGLHFPVFARLQELCKLQFLGAVLKHVLKVMKDNAEASDKLLHEIQQLILQEQSKLGNALRDLQQQVGVWPAADDYHQVSSAVRAIQRDLPTYVSYSYNDIEPIAKAILQKKDSSTFSQVVDILMKWCGNRVSRSTLQGYVRPWLSNPSSNEHALINLILPTRDYKREIEVQKFRQEYNNFHRKVEQLKVSAHTQSNIKNPCKWVPAAMHKRESSDGTSFSLCYGGVLIAPKIKQGFVSPSRYARTVKVEPVLRKYCAQQPVSRTLHTHMYVNPNRSRREPTHHSLRRTGQQARAFSASSVPSTPADTSLPTAHSAQGARGGGRKSSGTSGDDKSSKDRSSKSDRSTKISQDGRPSTSSGGGGDGGESSSSDEETELDLKSKRWHFRQLLRMPGFNKPNTVYVQRLLFRYAAIVKHYWNSVFQQYHPLLQTVGKVCDEIAERAFDSATSFSNAAKKNFPGPSSQSARCKLCGYYEMSDHFRSTKTGQEFPSIELSNCKTKCVVYLVTCKVTDKQYIGRTIQPLCKRFYSHFYAIKQGRDTALGEHFSKYGVQNMTVQIIDQPIRKELNKTEAYWIQKLEPELNRRSEKKILDKEFVTKKDQEVATAIERAKIRERVTPLCGLDPDL